MAVRKIPQPISNKQVQATFRAPQLQDGMSKIYKGVADIGHNILDQKAKEEGYQKGYKEITEGTNQKPIKDISDKQSFTIRGNSYKKGAQAAFVAEKSTEMTTELGTLFNNYKATGDGEAFETEAKKYRDKLAQETPSNLQPLLLPKVDQAIADNTVKLAGVKLSQDINMNVAKQTDRINIITENIAEAIVLDDGSGDDLFAEAIGIINSLVEQGHIDATSINTYKQLLTVPVFEGEIKKYFESLPDDASKLEFLEKVKNQGVTFFATENEIVDEIQKKYANDLKEILPDFDFNKPTDTQLAKIIAKASTEFAEKQDQNTELKKWMAEKQLNQIYDAWEDPKKLIDEVITKESIIEFGLSQNIDDDVIAGMLRTHEIYSDAETLLIGYEGMGLKQLQEKIDMGNIIMDNADDTTEEGLKLYDVNKLANGVLTKRIEAIATAYENEEAYALLLPNYEVNTAEDYIVRRNLLAKKLNLGSADQLPLFDKKEKELLKDQADSMSVNDVVNAVNFAEELGISLDNPQILTELGLDMTKEAIILMPDMVNKKMLAQGEIRYDENVLKLKSIDDGSGINAYQEITAQLDTLMIDYQNIDPVTFNRMKTFLEVVAVDKRANIKGLTGEQAVEEALKMFEKVYRTEEFRDQKFIVPAGISKDNWEATETYLEDMLTNQVKYGFVLPGNTLLEDFSTDNYAIEYSNGTLTVVQQDVEGGTSGVPVSIKNPQNADDDKISISRVEINLDNNARQEPNENPNKNKHWDHEITSASKEILDQPIEIAEEYKNENIVEIQNQIRIVEDEIAKIDAGIGPDTIKHALKMGPNQRLMVLQVQLQELMTQVDGPKDNDENYEIAYFRISQESNFVDTFTQHITNVPNQQQVISGIMLKNAQPNATWTEDELLYLSQYTAYEGLMDPQIRDYVVANWPDMREQGGFATLRTGYKLTPAGTLYVLIQDAIDGQN